MLRRICSKRRRPYGLALGGRRVVFTSSLPRTVSARDVSSRTAPVARSSPMLAPQARHRQLAQMPTGRSDGCCRPRRSCARALRPAAVGVGQVGVTQPAPGLEGPGHRVRDDQEVPAAGVDHRDARARARAVR